MKIQTVLSFTAAASFLLVPMSMHAQTAGVSNPEVLDDTIATTSSGGAHYEKPAAAAPIPGVCPAPAPDPTLHVHIPNAEAPIVYGAYKPYIPPVSTPAVASPAPSVAPVKPSVAVTLTGGESSSIAYGEYKPYHPEGEPVAADLPMVKLAEGTELDAKLLQPISTKSTAEGAHFTASLDSSYTAEGKIVLPVGSLVHGRVTRIHGGHIFGGNAAIHMQPDTVSTPDGMVYRINAEVSGLDHAHISHVNEEGSIVGNLNAKGTAAMLGFTTGSTVVVGAMVGGGVGALVGLGVGAGITTVWWLKQDRQLSLPEGTPITFTLANAVPMRPVLH